MCFVESSLSEGEDGGRKTSEEAHAIVRVRHPTAWARQNGSGRSRQPP